MFRNFEAEQKRFGLTNSEVADRLGISRATYESKKKTRKFTKKQGIPRRKPCGRTS